MMTIFDSCDRAGHDTANGTLMFQMTDRGKQVHQFSMTVDCFMSLFVMGWKAAEHLPPAARQGESKGLQSKASFAVVNTQPGLVLLSGPLVLSIILDKQQIADLQNEIGRFASGPNEDQKH